MHSKLLRTLSAMLITFHIVFVIGFGQVLNWMATQPPNIAVHIPLVLAGGIALQLGLAFTTEKFVSKFTYKKDLSA